MTMQRFEPSGYRLPQIGGEAHIIIRHLLHILSGERISYLYTQFAGKAQAHTHTWLKRIMRHPFRTIPTIVQPKAQRQAVGKSQFIISPHSQGIGADTFVGIRMVGQRAIGQRCADKPLRPIMVVNPFGTCLQPIILRNVDIIVQVDAEIRHRIVGGIMVVAIS